MQKQNYKGRCEKISLKKSSEPCRTYSPIQLVYARELDTNDDIKEISCNVLLDDFSEGAYTTDFVCTKSNGDLMIRECVFRKFLTKPKTIKLLDASCKYWFCKGISDWGIVIDAE